MQKDDQRIELEYSATASIKYDRIYIDRLVTNLLSNAIKYGDPGYLIFVKAVDGDNNTVVVSVQNTGKQIPKDEVGHVFDRFYRTKAVRAKVAGTGIGLSICKMIVEKHNGTITVDSTPNKTTFTFTLPTFISKELAQ